MIRIFKISLINGNNCPVLRYFDTDKVIDYKDIKVYKKRLKTVFEKRYHKQLNVDLKYCELESKYDEP
jgi:hypothetical protein